MHPPAVKAEALELVKQGLNDCEISRRLSIPRSTIRDWRRPNYIPRGTSPWNGDVCPRCWRPAKALVFSPGDYAELLSMYLGDGSISEYARTHRLRIVLDLKYQGIIEDTRALLRRCFPRNQIDAVASIGCVHVSVSSSHLACLFPQHGPGRKHERSIELEPWQQRIVEAAPWPFIRGCIRTDGCAFVNRTNIHREVPYEYLSYDFTNMSQDIAQLFMRACDLVGVEYRATNGNARGVWRVRINRRASVALMETNVGLKT